ncbi:MAG: hypothetical protein IPH94_16605 [Saprospiraceae bacterium]|nr:hypothetical protein [Saprospiraceae bacterium]
MKNKIAFLTGILAYVGLALILSAYGNKDMHTYINDAITDAFIKQLPSDPDLKIIFTAQCQSERNGGYGTRSVLYH